MREVVKGREREREENMGAGVRRKRKRERETRGLDERPPTSSITNSCPSTSCRYIQTSPRKGQSLCRPLCRPLAFPTPLVILLLLLLLHLLFLLSPFPPPPLPSPRVSSFTPPCLLGFSSRGKGAGPHTFVNRRPRSRRASERATKQPSKQEEDQEQAEARLARLDKKKVEKGGEAAGEKEAAAAVVADDEEAKDRMSEESVMRSLNTNAARPNGVASRSERGRGTGAGEKETKQAEGTRGKARRERTEVKRRRRRGCPERWRAVQWIGEGKRQQGVLDSEGISDWTVPSTIRFLPRKNLEFPSRPRPAKLARTGH